MQILSPHQALRPVCRYMLEAGELALALARRYGRAVSPLRKVTRQAWIDAASGLVSEGENLAEVSFPLLGARVGATKGSFYSNFPGKLAELHAEVIARWQRERIPRALAGALGTVRDPLDRLRMLRAASVDSARRDDAVRRWAATEPRAAAALADSDQAIVGYMDEALRDLGFGDPEADVLAAVIAPMLASVGPGDFETLLAVLTRAAVSGRAAASAGGASAGGGQRAARRAGGAGQGETGLVPGVVPDEAVIYSIASTLPPEARAQLRVDAQRFAATVSRGSGRPAGRGGRRNGPRADGKGTVALAAALPRQRTAAWASGHGGG